MPILGRPRSEPTLYKAIATLAFVLLVAGAARCRDRRTHVPLVVGAMSLDLALVLVLEFTRDVIGLVLTEPLGGLQITHIAASTLAVLLYFPTFVFGLRLMRAAGDTALRSRHRGFALAALTARAVGFGFMWSI